MGKENLMSVKECSKLTGISTITLMNGLKQGKFPFGTAVESHKTQGFYRYIIYRKQVEEILGSKQLIN